LFGLNRWCHAHSGKIGKPTKNRQKPPATPLARFVKPEIVATAPSSTLRSLCSLFQSLRGKRNSLQTSVELPNRVAFMPIAAHHRKKEGR